MTFLFSYKKTSILFIMKKPGITTTVTAIISIAFPIKVAFFYSD